MLFNKKPTRQQLEKEVERLNRRESGLKATLDVVLKELAMYQYISNDKKDGYIDMITTWLATEKERGY